MGRQQVFNKFFRSKASLKVSSSPKCSFVYKRAFFSEHCILQGRLKLSPLFFSFSGRVGKIRVLSFKIGLVTMARAHLEDKYKCKNLKVWFFFVDAYISSCVVQLKKRFDAFFRFIPACDGRKRLNGPQATRIALTWLTAGEALSYFYFYWNCTPNIETKRRLLFGKYRHLDRSKIFSWSTI